METKKRFKLYKSGKLWVCSAVAFVSLGLGIATQEINANADTNTAQTTTMNVQQSAATENLADTKVALTSNQTTQTTSSDNQVPVDQTTRNNVSANNGNLDSASVSTDSNGKTSLNVSGWHATGQSNTERNRWVIVYDNTTNREVTRQQALVQERDDVQKAYPNIANSKNSGFNLSISIPANVLNHSLSLVSRYSNDALHGEGQHTDYWFPITFDETNRASMDGMEGKNGQVTVSGWHASNQAAGMKYHYIIAYDKTTNSEITRQLVNASDSERQDVAEAFPTIANAGRSGFRATFNLTSRYANHDIQFISRWTNDPAGNGSTTVDYWFSPVTKQDRGNLDSFNISNGHLVVSGWHANDVSIYEPNHYLIVFDNTTGRQVASQKIDLQDSSDVAKAYSDTRTAGHSRFTYDFGNLYLVAGHSYSIVSRYSQDANGNGNDGAHTDYWYPGVTPMQSAYSIDGWQPSDRSMKLNGWFANGAADGYQYAYVILLDSKGELGRQRVTLTERQDVANAYPTLFNSLNSGFDATINFDRAVDGDLQVVFRLTNDASGNSSKTADIWSQKYATNAASFDTMIVNANGVQISGWHAADNIADKPYQYIIAMDATNNSEITRWNVTNSASVRNDVQKAYPWIVNSNHSGFSLNANGVNLTGRAGVYFIHRYTDDAAGNGNYVDIDSNKIYFVQYNMYANRINAYIANNHIGHANIQTNYVIPAVTKAYTGTSDGKPNMVVVHETANPNDSICGEINYEKSTYNNAFVHAFVDGNNIIEISSTDREAWGAAYPANGRAVQFEQVEVYGRDNFVRELVNAAYYTAYKMQQYGMVPNLNGASGNLFSHHMVSQIFGGTNHTDPDGYWANRASSYFGTTYTMSDFFELVKYEYKQL